MITIRKGIFETNSSSTHVITIAKEDFSSNDIKEIKFINGIDFGWNYNKYSDANSKFTYLLIAMSGMKYEDFKRGTDLITKSLKGHGVERIIYPEIKVKEKNKNDIIVELKENDPFENSTIDHGTDFVWELYRECQSNYYKAYWKTAGDFLYDVLKDEETIIRFLLDENSWITTGNDNSEGYLINEAYGFLPDIKGQPVCESEEHFMNVYNELIKTHDVYLK